MIDSLERADPALSASECYLGLESRDTLYETLEDDSAQNDFKPVISIDVNFSEVLSRLSSSLVGEVSSWLLVDSISCSISLFDNTIGILEVSANAIRSWPGVKGAEARDLDKLSTRLCSQIVTLFNGFFDVMIERLLASQKKYDFFYHKSDFVAFSDVVSLGGYESRVLWVGRTLFLNEEYDGVTCDFFNGWVGGDYLGGDSFNSGNNLLDAKSFPMSDLARSMVICQYFNSALMVLNINLDAVDILGDSIEKDYKKISLMKRQVELFDIDEMGVKNGLQGRRRELCTRVLDAWNHDELKQLVRKRLDLIGARLEEVHSKKMSRYSSVMEALLAFIGAVTLVDVSVSLFSYTNVDYKEGRPWSILEMVRNSDPDFLISFLVLVSILFGVFYVRKQQN